MLKLLFAAALAFAAPDESLQPLTPTEAAQLEQNLMRGELLFRYDQSAWHVTDAAMAALPDDAKAHLRGYVTTPATGGLRTTFFGENSGSHFAVYSATWTGSEVVDAEYYPPSARRPITDEQRRLIEARRVAVEAAAGLGMCSEAPANAIVVPGETEAEPISVYILTPQTESDVYPMGGHHRVDILDGKVVAKRAFTKSCIRLERGNAVGLVITHLLDPVPTEIHAFSVLATGLPLYVSVNDGRVYVVEASGGIPRARVVGNVAP